IANGAPDSAAAYLRRALAEPPSGRLRPDVLLELGFAESYAGDPQAAAHLQAALDIAPVTTAQVSITLALGRMLQIGGRNREALADARRLGSLPHVLGLSCYRALHYLRIGNLADAEPDARVALETGPRPPGLHAAVALAALLETLAERGESEAADAADKRYRL